MIDFIKTDKAPKAAGHYSQATVANGFIFTAVTLPINPANPDEPKGSVKEQAAQVLDNIFEVVKAGGGNIYTIMKVTIFVSNTNYWDEINDVYTEKFAAHKPARGVLEINNIRKGYDVAMEAIATTKAVAE